MKAFFAKIIFGAMATSIAFASIDLPKSAEDDSLKIATSIEQCQKLKSYIVKNQFNVECNSQYLLFGSASESGAKRTSVKIANYNLLHPGTSKTLFKDYGLVAKVMNSFDVVSAQELLGLVGHDADVNEDIDLYLAENSKDAKKQNLAKSIYRSPGYFTVLKELRKLDPSWSLIITPRGDSALLGSVEEYVGFYFRSSQVELKSNRYCEDQVKVKTKIPAYACMVNFGVKNKFISRRPLIASFQSSKFKFSMISSHVVFNFSGDENETSELIKSVFGANSLEEIGKGVNVVNFARLAEVKLTLEFMKSYSTKYNDKKIMFAADTNLNPDIEYWNDLLALNAGSQLLIKEPTTLSPQRFNKKGEETKGTANSYDHFVLNPSEFSTCDSGQVFNFYNSNYHSYIEKNYLIRDLFPKYKNKGLNLNRTNPEDPSDSFDGETDGEVKLDYPLSKAGEDKMNAFANNFRDDLLKLKTVKNGEIVIDDFQIEERVDGLKNRLFLKQLTNLYFYRVYQEILSDHMPAYISCKLN